MIEYYTIMDCYHISLQYMVTLYRYNTRLLCIVKFNILTTVTQRVTIR